MKTKDTLKLEINNENLDRAGGIIRAGGLVSFPTETVYGLGADALNEEAVASIYEAKGRPSDNPLIIHISSVESVEEIAYLDDIDDEIANKDILGNTDKLGNTNKIAKRDKINQSAISRDTKLKLMKKFWPGPITFILKKKDIVPDITSGGLSTVGVRLPSSKVARDFITAAKRPIAAPSANISGKPSPTRWQDVIEDMDGRIDAILKGNDCEVGIESTVLDLTGEIATIVRPGYITPKMIEEVTPVKYDKSLNINPSQSDFKPIAPGMKYKHYAPKARVRIVKSQDLAIRLASEAKNQGKKIQILDYQNNSERAARDFFARLRQMDRQEVEIIYVVALDDEELGYSVMNRMLKSAGYDVVE